MYKKPKGMYWDFPTQKWKKVSTANKALKIAKQNKKQLRGVVEHRGALNSLVTTPFNATPIVKYIAPEGDGFVTLCKSVQVKGTIKQDPVSTVVDDYRIDLVLDREPNKTEITPLLFYGDATPDIGHFKNIIYNKRFKVLRTYTSGFDEANQGRSIDAINWYVRLNLVIESATLNSFVNTSVIKNAVYLIYWTSSTTNQPIPRISMRMICKDSNA